ncbi:suppressor of glycerol defect [Clarireedia jacksonii]
MAPFKTKAPKLPSSLLQQLGVDNDGASGRGRKRPGRKELRKAERQQKKEKRTQKTGAPPQKRLKSHHTRHDEDDDDDDEEEEEGKIDAEKPKSILKRTKKADPPPAKAEPNADLNSKSEAKRISKAVKDKLAEDDDEIAALEKKLGLKGKKKLPQSFKDDGLDELLDGLEDDEDVEVQSKKNRKAEEYEWLMRKRQGARKRLRGEESDEEEEDDGEDEDMFDESDEGGFDDEASDMSLGDFDLEDGCDEDETDISHGQEAPEAEDDFEGFGSEGDDDSSSKPKTRENPYVAPISASAAPSGKYVPPSLRKPSSSDSEDLVRLRRQTQGLVNRLTEANLISLLGEIEKLYRANPRQHMTSTLIDLLLTSVCEPTSLPDTLIILPAGFIAAIYKIIGTDFGAQVIQRVVELFDEHYARAVAIHDGATTTTSDGSKETSNLIAFLSELYNFQVVGSNLIFDYIKLFLSKLSELNAELLLKIVRISGPQLRQDDPSSLKDIVTMLGPAVQQAGGEGKLSVRTKFMIETINDLKNNKMKTGGVASAVTSEHTVRMKKTLGSLNNRSLKASEPLRIGLKDIKESDKKGKWWLVGASWAGNAEDDDESSKMQNKKEVQKVDAGTSDLVQLAREQRMNTDIRRAIFITIMSASDYQDAYLRLMKLKLKKVQELEIPKVLVHCSSAEKLYNPYYTLIAKRLCGDRKLKMAFQFSLWDLFKRMGETNNNDDDNFGEDEELDTRHIVNLAKMFGTLITEGALGLSVLKNLNLSYLQTKTKTFCEVLFITILLQSQKGAGPKRDEKAISNIFSRVRDIPHMVTGLQYFLKKVVSKTDIAGGKEEKNTVKWACGVARDILQSLPAAVDTRGD